MSAFKKDQLNDYNVSSNLEWLETNGLGGYSSSSVAGSNTRRYHGVLVAATNPPVGRMVVLSKLEETLVVKDQRFELSSNQYPGSIYPQGYQFLKSFTRNLFPEFRYEADGVEIKKTIASIHGENTVVIFYEVLQAKGKVTLELMPLASCKDHHSEAHANNSIYHNYLFDDGVFQTLNYERCPELFISVPGSSFVESKAWYYNYEHAVEQSRGLDYAEDLYTHGHFEVTLKPGEKLGVIVSIDDPRGRNAARLVEEETARREAIAKPFAYNDGLRRLALAADQFIVKRGELNTIIAGYPWFADWGRDTMISLPGLCLATGRFHDLKNILRAFADSVSQGMLPNRFPDHGEAPEYNTIDATLWFFVAIYKYYLASKDKEFITSTLPVLTDIIEWHYKGTRYHIRVDPADELLAGGQDGVQLTWMDARVGDWVVTPRRGKPVEINALWYNALNVLSYFHSECGAIDESRNWKAKADKVHGSFNEKFWNDMRGCLYDYIEGNENNADLRPNQLFAISLPFPLLTKQRATKVLKVVTDQLLTPKGLRSLERPHPDYRYLCCGSIHERDGAYHQGTVWSFLIGPYVDALLFVKGDKARKDAARIIEDFLKDLDEGCVGSISEIFDGEEPHTARGCFAQAWGVAEGLRAAVEHKLFVEQTHAVEIVL
ncbi:MAG TPA: amylo-alpha-1,6-glucosidase [Cyclobacteriaceae bacterium]|nr:amylo-alpha-1,6-glucosidase [Cyclobacteriaceae bacterium]